MKTILRMNTAFFAFSLRLKSKEIQKITKTTAIIIIISVIAFSAPSHVNPFCFLLTARDDNGAPLFPWLSYPPFYLINPVSTNPKPESGNKG